MRICLVGHTGFVGSNIHDTIKKYRNVYVECYNSKNINELKNSKDYFDLLILCALPGNMQFANANPQKDYSNMKNVLNNIKNVNTECVALVSSICVNDDTPYGKTRLIFEREVYKNFKDRARVHIYRLPGIYGNNLKKNVIYDMMHICPSFIKVDRFKKIIDSVITSYVNILTDAYKYDAKDDVYKLQNSSEELEDILKEINFTSLGFWNLEDTFYWYDIRELYHIIHAACTFGTKEFVYQFINDEPISVADIAEQINGLDLNLFTGQRTKDVTVYNEINESNEPKVYLFKTDKELCIKSIIEFINENR